MMKPSRKVISTMVIIGAITVAFIVSDKIKANALEKADNPKAEVEGVIEPDNNVKTLQDFIAEKFAEESSVASTDTAPKTITESALAELFVQYSNLKAKSMDSDSNINALTSNLAEQTKNFAKLPDKYSFIDIKTFPDYQKDKAKQYGNQFASTFEKYYRQEFLIENTGDDMKFIEAYSNIQIKFGDELANLSAPRNISDEHLEYANNLVKSGIAIVKIAEIEGDPLLSAVILDQYNEIRFRQSEILKNIAEYFRENDIIFSDSEPGAMWNNF